MFFHICTLFCLENNENGDIILGKVVQQICLLSSKSQLSKLLCSAETLWMLSSGNILLLLFGPSAWLGEKSEGREH